MIFKKNIINYNEENGEYSDTAVYRGFPLGGMGTGGFNIGTDGAFTEFRINNNWMNPVRKVRGTFFAIHTSFNEKKETRILRKSSPGKEFSNIKQIRSSKFSGELPEFDLSFDDDLPVKVKVRGFTPHIPHNIKDSTIPGVIFSAEIENVSKGSADVSFLFSWENILGLGGSGTTGVKQIGKVPIGFNGRSTYRDVTGNYQERVKSGSYHCLAFRTKNRPDSRSHRYSTTGEYRLAVLPPEGFDVSLCEGWNSREKNPLMMRNFVRSGKISSPEKDVVGGKRIRPAAAIAVSGKLAPGETIEVPFTVVWWTPDHVTEHDLVKKHRNGKHDGKREGHIYENYFKGPDEIVEYFFTERERLYNESIELPHLIDRSTLPGWLKRAMKNSIDSILCNTVIPEEGTMYTIEGMDWQWPIGGLTGTNDQRLSSHPYTSLFFTELDMSEIDMFRKLMNEEGACPHGNGNCDLGLGTSDVPYGWPMEITFVLHNDRWTDLTASEIIQAGKLYRITGDRSWIDKFWPDMKKMAVYLESISVEGVPEGGSTYDIPEWEFNGTFIYAATVYLAALKTMIDIAMEIEPGTVETYRKRFNLCKKRIDDTLWNEEKGYYQSTPENENMFAGGLAGDWVSRFGTLGPILEEDRVKRHMKLQHEFLIVNARKKAEKKGEMPHPWSAVRIDGSEIKFRGPLTRFDMFKAGIDHQIYLWQVFSYQAMEHIYLGQMEEGLDIIKMIYDRLYKKGLAWSGHLNGSNESVYMTHPVIWALLNAMTGASLDVPAGVLNLSQRLMPGEDEASIPFCFPGFWAMMHYKKNGSVRIDVVKHFGKAVVINKICFLERGEVAREIEMESGIEMVAGASWEGTC